MSNKKNPASAENLDTMIKEAEALYQSGDLESAFALYTELISFTATAPYAYYRLAGIANAISEPETAKELYYKAFILKPDICRDLFPDDHTNHNYIFRQGKNEPPQRNCPLCGLPGKAFWCYCMVEVGAAYYQNYNPIRVWLRCEECNHLFAEEFPVNQYSNTNAADLKNITVDKLGIPTKREFFSYYSEIISRLTQFTAGVEIIEVGIGGCECMLVA